MRDVMDAGAPLVFLVQGIQADEVFLRMAGHLSMRYVILCGLHFCGAALAYPVPQSSCNGPQRANTCQQAYTSRYEAHASRACLRGRAGDNKVARDAAPDALAVLLQAQQKQPVLVLSPRNALPALLVALALGLHSNTGLVRVSLCEKLTHRPFDAPGRPCI